MDAKKITECWRIDTFELWCWRRLLRVPWTVRRSNQSILKEISPEYSLEELMLKLKLQYFDHLMWRTDSLEKTLMLGKIEGGRRRGRQRMRWFDGITNFMDMSLSKLWVGDGQGGLACCSPWGHEESDTAEQLNWIEIYIYYKCLIGSLFSYYGLKLAVSSFDVCYLFLQSPTLPNMEVSTWFLILLSGLFIRSLEA